MAVNTDSSSHSVDKKLLIGDLQAGLAIQIHRIRITYTQIFRTKEYKGQDSAEEFRFDPLVFKQALSN